MDGTARLPSLKDKYREMTNKEIAAKTQEIKADTKQEKVVKNKIKK